MYFFKTRIVFFIAGAFLSATALAQNDAGFTSISLNDLSAFSDPPANWKIASNATADFMVPNDMKPISGTGAVVNDVSKNNRMHLYTKEEFADLEVELDFMMASKSNSGIYLMGRYEVQLLDSWTRLNPTSSDAGGIYLRWTAERGTFEGTAPATNVARAPGLWQHLQIKFRAPQFDANGRKIKNARFESVMLNGVLIQQSVFVTGPTGSSMFRDEKATGPLVLQGDHGQVAFKNIRYRSLPPLAELNIIPNDYTYWESRNPVLVEPQGKNYLLRSFMNFGKELLTHVISVGSPAEVNFSYDLKQGALFQVWRGKFLDATRMWVGRGEPQLARPLGSVISLGDAPAVAVLNTETAAWPDSVAFDGIQLNGYTLNKQRTPVFSYRIAGAEVKDSIGIDTNGQGITRAISTITAPANLYCRVVNGKNITKLSDDLYLVNDSGFYLRVDKKYKPVIRPSINNGQELVVKMTGEPIIYKIIW